MVADTFLIVLIVRCFKKTVYFLFFHSYNFVTVSPLSSKTNNCYNITSVILTIYFCPLKLDVFILHRKIFPIHHTCTTCLFFSFLLIYKTRPNDLDLQLGRCISDAFLIFYIYCSPTRFSDQMLLNSNRMGAISREGTAYPSTAHRFTLFSVRFMVLNLVFCISFDLRLCHLQTFLL